jgi:DNA-directed RNA polymerase specialized sigma24 family protein
MTDIPISPEILKLASQVCTPKQLTVLELREQHGYSWHMICITLDITKTTAREHHAAATRNIYNALNTNGRKPRLVSEGGP